MSEVREAPQPVCKACKAGLLAEGERVFCGVCGSLRDRALGSARDCDLALASFLHWAPAGVDFLLERNQLERAARVLRELAAVAAAAAHVPFGSVERQVEVLGECLRYATREPASKADVERWLDRGPTANEVRGLIDRLGAVLGLGRFAALNPDATREAIQRRALGLGVIDASEVA